MKRVVILCAMALILSITSFAQSPTNYRPNNTKVKLDSTNLPIVWIEVDGVMIERNNRITARMKIIHNGDGMLNYADTVAHPNQNIDYEGYVGLRYRGNTSYSRSDKKPYSFRPLDKPLEEGGEKKKVDILGMGKDNNWALLAPYSDKSMMRDLLAFEISKPWMEYTPEGRYCELFLDGIYYGVYILSEVVSKGKTRLNLPDPGETDDELTGGYLVEVDRFSEVGFGSKYHPVSSTGVKYKNRSIRFSYQIPDYEDMTEGQIAYIKAAVNRMEDALASANYCDPETGYRKYLDVMSFIDYQIVMELGHSVDGYRLSCKLFKRRDSVDSRFKLALWDMNIAFGNNSTCECWRTDTWLYQNNEIFYEAGASQLVPFWWYQLNNDPEYTAALRDRWAQYRKSNLREDRIMATVDSLANEVTSYGAEERNSKAWPRWGVWVWPNYYVAESYADEIAWLKNWLHDRIAWMDEQLGYTSALRGDVNGDGIVDVSDVIALIDYVLQGDSITTVDPYAYDCNQDDDIDISDVIVLIDIVLYGIQP